MQKQYHAIAGTQWAQALTKKSWPLAIITSERPSDWKRSKQLSMRPAPSHRINRVEAVADVGGAELVKEGGVRNLFGFHRGGVYGVNRYER
jgi:hypothetical protein